MGFPRAMKRKFSFSSLRLKPALPVEESRADYDTESPPYSPTPSAMERPSVHPQLLYDLRQACAILVNQTNPPDPDEEPDLHDNLRKFEAERKAKYMAQNRVEEKPARKVEVREVKPRIEEVKPRKRETREEESRRQESRTAESRREEPRKDRSTKHETRRPREGGREAGSKQSTEHQGSQPITISSGAAVGRRQPSETYRPSMEPVEPVHTTVSNHAQGQRKEAENPALTQIRASIHTRPKTSAAACVDYSGSSDAGSSKSTSRSTSNYEAVYRPTSTGLTSLAHTPGEEKRRSHQRRPSDGSDQEEQARAESRAWMAQELERRRAEEYANSGRAARPGSRASKFSRMTSRSERSDWDRPASRAGSIASSIADGISNYMRPRASVDSMRSGRSSAASGLSRSHSRSSSMSRRSSSSGWWRNGGGLRRRGSWASFRSARPGDGEEKSTRKNGEPNLNRPLPALPGLDQYRETKTHIGQLMKAGGRGRRVNKKSISDPQPLLAPNTEYTATLPKQTVPLLDNAVPGAAPTHIHPRPHQPPTTATTTTNENNSNRAPLPKNLTLHPTNKPPKQPKKDRRSSSNHSASTANNPPKPNRDSQKPPPMIRGPSYSKEVATGVYPRPMEVAPPLPLPAASERERGRSPHAKPTAGATVSESDVGGRGRQQEGKRDRDRDRDRDRERGSKWRVGRMFGGAGGGGREVVAM